MMAIFCERPIKMSIRIIAEQANARKRETIETMRSKFTMRGNRTARYRRAGGDVPLLYRQDHKLAVRKFRQYSHPQVTRR